SSVVLIPSYLAAIQNYRPEQTGAPLLWLAIPQLLAGALAVYLLGRVDARLILAAGFALVAVACLMDAQITTLWSGNSFYMSQLILAIGEGLAFNGMVGSIVLDLLNSGGMENASAVLSFGGFFQTVRLFGGELGASFVQFFLHSRQVFHYDHLASGLANGSPAVLARMHLLTAGMRVKSEAANIAAGRAAGLFVGSVRQQAFTLAIMDSFTLIACAATACLFLVLGLHSLKVGFKQIIAASAQKKAAS
ncbi:MAG TPA: MFS transporter, partial [Acidobacteriaceae bacterium]